MASTKYPAQQLHTQASSAANAHLPNVRVNQRPDQGIAGLISSLMLRRLERDHTAPPPLYHRPSSFCTLTNRDRGTISAIRIILIAVEMYAGHGGGGGVLSVHLAIFNFRYIRAQY